MRASAPPGLPVPAGTVPLHAMQAGLAIGLVGAGRTRNGLGPYLARALEHAGAQVTGVSGRDAARAESAAAELARQLGHPVTHHADAPSLARSGVQALVVASPPEAHLDGLRAALAAGVPCLCEKPLVTAAATAAGVELVAAFQRRGLLLVENCQWPFTLPALFELYPRLRAQAVRSVEMLLAPARSGLAMVEDTLSHLLSVVQALAPGDLALTRVVLADPPEAPQNVLQLGFAGAAGPIAVTLRLVPGPAQPRPAWLSVDGCRMDRRIGENYALSFTDGARAVSVDDPMAALVYGFVESLRSPSIDRIRAHAESVALRLRLYGEVLARIGPPR
jgi:predicted dehydrogenase